MIYVFQFFLTGLLLLLSPGVTARLRLDSRIVFGKLNIIFLIAVFFATFTIPAVAVANEIVDWTQIGADIDGEAEGDSSGYSVSLSADGFHSSHWGTP